MKYPFDLTVRPLSLPLSHPYPADMQIFYPLDRNTIVGSKQKDLVGEKKGTVSATHVNGKIGAALEFNGTTHYFDLNHSPDILADGALTIAFWTKGAPGAAEVILGLGNVFEDTSWNRIQFNWSTPKMRLYTKDDAGTVVHYTTNATLLDNAWHSVVGVISPVDNKTVVYVDGELDGGGAGALGAFTFEDWTFHAGCLYNDGARESYAAGFTDEIMFINKEWDALQARAFDEGRLIE